MDDRDVEILKAIAELGTMSSKAIEERTGIPKSTVHYRIDNLQESGVIEDDLFTVDFEELGLGLTVISEVLAEFEEGYHREVGEKLSEIEGVNSVFFTMGDTDFIVIAHLPNREQIEDLVNAYEGIDQIKRTSSSFVITTIKDESTPLADYDLETLQAINRSES